MSQTYLRVTLIMIVFLIAFANASGVHACETDTEELEEITISANAI